MNRRPHPHSLSACLVWLACAACSLAGEFRSIGDFVLQSRLKLTGARVTPIIIKPMILHVTTDGIQVKVSTGGEEEAQSTFDIYRSDGIGRQNSQSGALEVIPGVQALGKQGGNVSHLRLTRETLTITQFPGVSDQTIVTHAVAVTPDPQAPPAAHAPTAKETPSKP